MKIDPGRKEVKILKQLLKLKGKRALEIGCGEGRVSFLLAPLAQNYIAIDSDKEAILKAKRRTPKNLKKKMEFRVAFGHGTGLPDKSVDAVVMVLCLHEMDPQKQGATLIEAWRVLKNKCQLLIIEPFPFGQVQSLYDVIHQKIVFFDHPMAVKHAQWVIKKIMESGKFRLLKRTKYKIDWHFDDLKELVNFIAETHGEGVFWTLENRQILKKGIEKLLKDRLGVTRENIVVYDEMAVFDLRKNKDARGD